MNIEKYAEFTAGSNDNGKRADRIIRQFIREQALSGIYKAFRKGLIKINGIKAKPEMKVKTGDSILIYKSMLTSHKKEVPVIPDALNQNLINQIIYEDDKLLALNKKKGQLVHGEKGSLEDQVRAYLSDKIEKSLSFRPGPLHRLDRNTSGLIFFSKSIEGAREFSQSLQDKKYIKYYIALLDGKLKGKEQWVDDLKRDSDKGISCVSGNDGKTARSTAQPLIVSGGYTLAMIKIETGRTHQIRVQASAHGHPLSGDKKYGGSFLNTGYFLHSFAIRDKSEKTQLIKDETKASIDKGSLKRLNRILTNVTIEEIEKRIFSMLEDL